MYFRDRAEAGQLLAERLIEKYRYENCVVLALSDGGVVVGAEIASKLHAILTYLVLEPIDIPGEGTTFGTVNQDGRFVANGSMSEGEQNDYYQEYHGYLEEQKREKFQRINELLGDGGVLDADMLRNHVVVLVTDSLDNGDILWAAVEFLKPIKVEKIIMVTPVASVPAVDRMHVLADEIHVLNVAVNYLGADHYYDENTVPSHEEIIKHISQSMLSWQ